MSWSLLHLGLNSFGSSIVKTFKRKMHILTDIIAVLQEIRDKG